MQVASETLGPGVWLLGRTKFFGKCGINELLNNWLRRRRSTDIQRFARYDCMLKARTMGVVDAAKHLGLKWRAIVRRPAAQLIQNLTRSVAAVHELRQRRVRREHAQVR